MAQWHDRTEYLGISRRPTAQITVRRPRHIYRRIKFNMSDEVAILVWQTSFSEPSVKFFRYRDAVTDNKIFLRGGEGHDPASSHILIDRLINYRYFRFGRHESRDNPEIFPPVYSGKRLASALDDFKPQKLVAERKMDSIKRNIVKRNYLPE